MGSKDRQIYNILKKGDLFVNNVKTDVLFTTEVQRIITNQNQKQLIVPRSSEKDRIINHFYKQMKSEEARKLCYRIKDHYVGVSRQCIQEWLNKNREHFRVKPSFGNKPPLRPVITKTVQSHHQIDLVNFEKFPVEKDGNIYVYVLSVLDIFSRFLQLRPLTCKEPWEVKQNLIQIYRLVLLTVNVATLPISVTTLPCMSQL